MTAAESDCKALGGTTAKDTRPRVTSAVSSTTRATALAAGSGSKPTTRSTTHEREPHRSGDMA